MNVTSELTKLRKVMADHQIQAVIIPTSDYHDTEYVCDYFSCRKHYSGFTGSAGTLVVLEDGGALWTDGRYYIQAENELSGSGLQLMKQGMPGVPSIPEYICEHLKPGMRVAADGRCINQAEYEEDKEIFDAHGLEFVTDLDIPGIAWENRPEMPKAPIWIYDEKFTGRSVQEKLKELREHVADAKAYGHATNKIDEIAWLFNIRANDIPNFPAPLSYALINPDTAILYTNTDRVSKEVRDVFENEGVTLREYKQIYDDLKSINQPILVQKNLVNSLIASSLANPVYGEDPIVMMKAVKNETEQEGFRIAHHKDAAAVIRFWKWLEETLPETQVTEVSAADKLHDFRAEQPGFLDESFTTISAYGKNAAMPHYHPDSEHPAVLESKGLYLVDSGGHYQEGTTDITRTFVLGDLTDEEKHFFTRVLQGNVNLAQAVFPKGVRGLNLDVLARGPLWKEMTDYNHGTGHGVGALSNVHEAPNGFRWKIVPERNDSAVMLPGMITSNEPGFYAEGKFGIRHENLMLTRDFGNSDFGDFLCHEILTLVPFDVRGLDVSIMSSDQIDWLNNYHQRVYEEIAPLLNEDEAIWLKEKTKAL